MSLIKLLNSAKSKTLIRFSFFFFLWSPYANPLFQVFSGGLSWKFRALSRVWWHSSAPLLGHYSSQA